jgi:cysteine desulfurase
MGKPDMIYLDNQATTPLAPEAREAMLRWLGGPDSDGFGNPHSPHRYGRMAHAAVDLAREQVAALFPPGGQVVFTGSATEALNLAIRGSGEGGTIAVSAIEHSAVYDTAAEAGTRHLIPVDSEGRTNLDEPLPEATRLVAVMQVNNEIGTVQDCAAWRAKAHAAGALFLCDAVQAAGKMAVAEADMIAVTGHKLHGPKGIGALWVRDGIALTPQITGGGQENGLRSGTLSPALIAGFGAAVKLALDRQEEDAAHARKLWHRARELFADWTLNGHAERRWHGNLNIRRDGLDVSRLMSDCRTIAFSAGSACASGSGKPSRVLAAIGLASEQAKGSIRLGFSRYTTMDELEAAAAAINAAADAQA